MISEYLCVFENSQFIKVFTQPLHFSGHAEVEGGRRWAKGQFEGLDEEGGDGKREGGRGNGGI